MTKEDLKIAINHQSSLLDVCPPDHKMYKIYSDELDFLCESLRQLMFEDAPSDSIVGNDLGVSSVLISPTESLNKKTKQARK